MSKVFHIYKPLIYSENTLRQEMFMLTQQIMDDIYIKQLEI